jgi:hypothetical protein
MEELSEFEAKVLYRQWRGDNKYRAVLVFEGGYTLNDYFVCAFRIRVNQKVKVIFTSPNITIIR